MLSEARTNGKTQSSCVKCVAQRSFYLNVSLLIQFVMCNCVFQIVWSKDKSRINISVVGHSENARGKWGVNVANNQESDVIVAIRLSVA